jgi:hypothetical protein
MKIYNYCSLHSQLILIIFICILIVIAIVRNLFYKNSGRWNSNHISNIIEIYNFHNVKNEEKRKISKGEQKCIQTLQSIFLKPFKKCRPNFLKYNGRNLELDGYNEELKIAVEYNGSQHYFFNPFFHKTLQDFYDLQKRDKFKMEKCKRENILLIIVPYTIPLEEISNYIRAFLNLNSLK